MLFWKSEFFENIETNPTGRNNFALKCPTNDLVEVVA